MDLLLKSEIEASDQGSHFIPYSVLERLRPDVKIHAASIYSDLVAEHSDYEIGMVRDDDKGGITVYWNRVA